MTTLVAIDIPEPTLQDREEHRKAVTLIVADRVLTMLSRSGLRQPLLATEHSDCETQE